MLLHNVRTTLIDLKDFRSRITMISDRYIKDFLYAHPLTSPYYPQPSPYFLTKSVLPPQSPCHSTMTVLSHNDRTTLQYPYKVHTIQNQVRAIPSQVCSTPTKSVLSCLSRYYPNKSVLPPTSPCYPQKVFTTSTKSVLTSLSTYRY